MKALSLEARVGIDRLRRVFLCKSSQSRSQHKPTLALPHLHRYYTFADAFADSERPEIFHSIKVLLAHFSTPGVDPQPDRVTNFASLSQLLFLGAREFRGVGKTPLKIVGPHTPRSGGR